MSDNGRGNAQVDAPAQAIREIAEQAHRVLLRYWLAKGRAFRERSITRRTGARIAEAWPGGNVRRFAHRQTAIRLVMGQGFTLILVILS